MKFRPTNPVNPLILKSCPKEAEDFRIYRIPPKPAVHPQNPRKPGSLFARGTKLAPALPATATSSHGLQSFQQFAPPYANPLHPNLSPPAFTPSSRPVANHSNNSNNSPRPVPAPSAQTCRRPISSLRADPTPTFQQFAVPHARPANQQSKIRNQQSSPPRPHPFFPLRHPLE